MSCSPAEFKTLSRARDKPDAALSNQIEMLKSVPQRYPSSLDSVGIELVGKASLPAGKAVPAGLSEHDRALFVGDNAVFEPVTAAQQVALQWLIDFLRQNLQLPAAEVHRHSDVSWKNPTEAQSARWQ